MIKIVIRIMMILRLVILTSFVQLWDIVMLQAHRWHFYVRARSIPSLLSIPGCLYVRLCMAICVSASWANKQPQTVAGNLWPPIFKKEKLQTDIVLAQAHHPKDKSLSLFWEKLVLCNFISKELLPAQTIKMLQFFQNLQFLPLKQQRLCCFRKYFLSSVMKTCSKVLAKFDNHFTFTSDIARVERVQRGESPQVTLFGGALTFSN